MHISAKDRITDDGTFLNNYESALLIFFRQSGYVGAIHAIFARNAAEHPDRTCVVETASSGTPQRSFTYKQIFEASNILAHFLHDAGVTNGDVVMIWAHRSVDLVISIMGTLVFPSFHPRNSPIFVSMR